jgi:Tol biopolymer transport system component
VIKLWFILFPLLTFLSPMSAGCAQRQDDKIAFPRFSPTNDKLIFDYCRRDERCVIAVYDLREGTLYVYQAPDNQIWSHGNFSRDGRQLAVVVNPLVDGKRDLFGQIAIMNTDASGFRKLTDSPNNFKIAPSFAPDDQRIIYGRANTLRKSGKTRFADYDVYDVDVKTGLERQLTNCQFFSVTEPFYFPDGKHFIFSGEWARPEGKTGAELQKYHKE